MLRNLNFTVHMIIHVELHNKGLAVQYCQIVNFETTGWQYIQHLQHDICRVVNFVFAVTR